MTNLEDLVFKHRQLDFLLESELSSNSFISDWNCEHPFYSSTFNKISIPPNKIQEYSYIRNEKKLNSLISNFHSMHEKLYYLENEILVSNGSSSIIAVFFLWLKFQKVEFIYYVPPLYFLFHFFARAYDIPMRPITKSHLYEKNIRLNLPERKTLLILTDPIWYAGFSIKKSLISKISKWQEKTQSFIFVDGSFQYSKWDLSKFEATSTFIKELTFRLVCPTKAIATHGVRFAYLLLPQRFYKIFDFLSDNLCGSSTAYDSELSINCMKIMLSNSSNQELIKYTCSIYSKLLESRQIFTEVKPNSGYFVFAKLAKNSSAPFITMNGRYFEQEKYEKYVRINLLGSAINKLY